MTERRIAAQEDAKEKKEVFLIPEKTVARERTNSHEEILLDKDFLRSGTEISTF